ncbi:MAG TPA: hypothetical protein VM889_10950 [Candidatus Thermoplasmatota archaeon]|nr:hypothetical protein [Candidatus Thermoplasmatota archaeon]
MDWAPIVGGIALLFVWLLAGFVFANGRASRAARILAGLLVLEGLFLLHVPMIAVDPVAHPWTLSIVPVSFFVSLTAMPWLYLLFLGTLDTPATRLLRPRPARRAVAALAVVVPAATLYLARDAILDPAVETDAPSWFFFAAAVTFLATLLYALVATVLAWRASPPGTPARARAGAYALAFLSRDVFYASATAFAITGAGIAAIGLDADRAPPMILAVGGFLYASFLAYGILRSHLFDLEIKLKLGLRRSTVATVFLVVFFVGFKLAESYASREHGWIFGALCAGLLLFAAPRVNKLADKVADTAMPKVQTTPAYVTFKKLEVYRAAVESAHESGGVNAKDKQALERLRAKLGLEKGDTNEIEREVTGAPLETVVA